MFRDRDLSLTRLLHVLQCTKSHAKQDPVRNGPAKSFNAQSHSDDPQPHTPARCHMTLVATLPMNGLDYYV